MIVKYDNLCIESLIFIMSLDVGSEFFTDILGTS